MSEPFSLACSELSPFAVCVRVAWTKTELEEIQMMAVLLAGFVASAFCHSLPFHFAPLEEVLLFVDNARDGT